MFCSFNNSCSKYVEKSPTLAYSLNQNVWSEGMQPQPSSLWQAVLGEIELSVSRGNFVTWFKNTCLLKQTDDTIVIGVPNVFVKNQLEKKYGGIISETLRKNGIEVKNIEYK